MRGIGLRIKARQAFFPSVLAWVSLALVVMAPLPLKAATGIYFSGAYSFNANEGSDMSVADVVSDSLGQTFVTGYLDGSVTFVGPGGPLAIGSAGLSSTFVAAYDSPGNLDWVRVTEPGEDSYTYPSGLTLDADGNVIVVGTFTGSVDFDSAGDGDVIDNGASPGSGVRSSYITKYSASGDYLWTQTTSPEGGTDRWSEARDVKTDSEGNIYVAGDFVGDMTFDGPDGDVTLDAGNNTNAYLTKYAANGNYVLTYTPDNSNPDDGDESLSVSVNGVSVDVDSEDNVYLAGDYADTVTFGGGDEYTASVPLPFITQITSTGSYGWTLSPLSNTDGESNAGVGDFAIGTDGNLYLTGGFNGSLAFDSESAIKTAENEAVYVAKYTNSGDYVWANTVVAAEEEAGFSSTRLVIGTDNTVFLAGGYGGPIHFDATCGTDDRTSDKTNVFLSVFSPTGNYILTKDLGIADAGFFGQGLGGLAISHGETESKVFLGGTFSGTVLLDGADGHFNYSSNEDTASGFVSTYIIDNSGAEVTCGSDPDDDGEEEEDEETSSATDSENDDSNGSPVSNFSPALVSQPSIEDDEDLETELILEQIGESVDDTDTSGSDADSTTTWIWPLAISVLAIIAALALYFIRQRR